MDDAKKQLVDKLKTANNILVTVSRDPSVDQLASCLGLALALNKQGKHTAAVFSGKVPSMLEFLKPEDTLEKNTDSLRDFIIALDKSKADKLRYKVEDNVVRIFITPYKTSISEADLDFSQGDFNVDLVVALGVGKQEDLDEAIMSHGRILHDATVASINLAPDGGLGSINWQDSQASSLGELVTDLVRALDPSLLDAQIATALLTGIVSSTNRFSNEKTSSQTMSASASLMAAGANQQLVASKLEEPVSQSALDQDNHQDEPNSEGAAGDNSDDDIKTAEDGMIEIEHSNNDSSDAPPAEPAIELPAPEETPADNPVSDDVPTGTDTNDNPPTEEPVVNLPSNLSQGSEIMTEPPSLGGMLTANSQPPALDPVTDPLSMPNTDPPQLLERKPAPAPAPAVDLTPPPTDWTPPADPPLPPPPVPVDTTPPADTPMPSLSDLEEEVKREEGQQVTQSVAEEATGLNTARDEVSRALNTAESTISPRPIEALNAQPMGDDLHPTPSAPPAPMDSPPANPQVSDPSAPPPVPPPIPFQFGSTNPPQ